MTVNWERVLSEAKSFFQSGFFYMLLGALLMYLGYRLSNDPFTHSAFVFLVVILGVAIFLFGTGTSASGDGTSGTIKVAIAGGAGVLAMVLGFGVASWHNELTDVFKRQRDYGIVELSIGETGQSLPADLDNFEARARWGEMPLPLWKGKQTIEILVPIPPAKPVQKKQEAKNKAAVEQESSILVELTPKPGFQGYTMEVDTPLKVDWRDGVEHRVGFNNELLEVVPKKLKQVSQPKPVPSPEPSARNAQSLPADIIKALPGTQ